jgi:hypothetical protein
MDENRLWLYENSALSVLITTSIFFFVNCDPCIIHVLCPKNEQIAAIPL